MTYTISKNCPAKIIVQALDGYYDYSEYSSPKAAWEAEKSAPWVEEYIQNHGAIEGAEAEFLASLIEATPAEALAAAEDGYGWPLVLGFVEEVEEA